MENGAGNTAGAAAAYSEGYSTQASGESAHAEGSTTIASGSAAHAEGHLTQATNDTAHAEGTSTTASGEASHAEGYLTHATGNSTHAEGALTLAAGAEAHAEGNSTQALGDHSHAEGHSTTASGTAAHAEGANTVAGGSFAHAEGVSSVSSGAYAHAEGANTTADGQASHAEGFMTQAFGANSHAEGENTMVMPDHTGAHIMGQNGSTRFAYSWHLANGLTVGPSLNSAVIEGATGNLYLDGTVISPAAADYAEMFETADGIALEPGYFVTFDGAGDKIRKATSGDSYILGVVSARPAILADSSDLRWHKLFVTDEWDRILYQEVEVPEVRDPAGNVLRTATTKIEPVLNPDWNASQAYIPRIEREEWVAVGILGKLLVRDDGTCQPGSYCMPNNDGIATAAPAGYRVLNRTRDDQIRIFVR
ncbi:peptidase G2 autoproteolytic cleavage domain-containing protein [Paenibacillus pedocola]|uniref:peptidase G2 autoproteolytic cleavage domain-containing protein n=1 Tax=Paenibacillus pedocola TaxID=3242193 RepID=UPI0028774012|nr:peptidase G2 autoproteolytic cleavage domain-containing protein [Paenibacillus typhae]